MSIPMVCWRGIRLTHAYPPRLRLRSSSRLLELLRGLIHAQCRRVQAVAIALKHFLLHEAHDLLFAAFLQQRSQLSLKLTNVRHMLLCITATSQRSTWPRSGASLCLWHTLGSQVRSIFGLSPFR